MSLKRKFAALPPERKRLIRVAVLLALAAVAWTWWRAWRSSLPYAGTLEATRIDLPARVATVVSSVEVEEGQKVEKGQVLLRLACDEVRLGAKLAGESFERAERLRKSGGVSEEAFDQLQNRKQDADTRLSWCDVASPISGTVLTRYLDTQEWANPGAKLITLADLRDLWAYVYVPTEVMARLKLGAPVRGLIPELDRREFKGVIRKINEEAEFTPKNVQTRAERTRLVFGVKVAFDNADGALKPGMTIEIDFED
jgi:HlyD family secretion protein